MLSVEMVRTSIPEFGTEPDSKVALPAMVLAFPVIAAVIPSMLALLDIGDPSMMIAVPRLFMDEATAVLRLRLWAVARFGLLRPDPGRSCITSFSELVRAWSIACREIIEAVASPALLLSATMLTCSRRKLLTSIVKS